jgi:signal transduction histidine kinase
MGLVKNSHTDGVPMSDQATDDAGRFERISSVATGLPGRIRRSYTLRFASALLLIVVFITLVGIYVQGEAAETIENDVEDQLVLEAETEATQLSEWLEGNKMPARLLSAHPTLNGSATQAQAHLENQIQTSLPDQISAAHIVDTGKGTFVSSTTTERIGDSVEDTAWSRQTSFTGFDDVVVSDPYRQEQGETVVAFLTPVVNEPQWVLMLTVPADEIQFQQAIEGTFTEVVRPVPGSTAVLFSDSPHQQATLQPYVPNATQSDIPELRNGLDGDTGFRVAGTKSAHLDRQYVTAYAPVMGTDWVVIKHAPAENAFGVRQDIRYGLLAFIAIALVGVLVIGGTLGRNTTRSIRDLSEKATQIENGNYDVTVEQDRPDEIGHLAESLDSMRDTLGRRITEAEQSRKQAEQLNEQLQVLDRLLRHNLNNDMNVIRLSAEAIEMQSSDGAKQHAKTILEKSDALLAKTEKQRKITRVLSTDSERIELDGVTGVESAVETVRSAYPDATVTVDSPDHATILATPEFDEAILELLENAIEHNDRDKPDVTVTLTRSETAVEIQISDNGPGIPEMDRQVLLSEQETDPLHHGSGVGLWVVFWAIQRAGGQIDIDENYPRGSVVTLHLQTPADGDES